MNPLSHPGHPGDRTARIRALTPEARALLARRLAGHSAPRESATAQIVATLRQSGIRWVAGVAGSPVDDLFDQAARQGLRLIGTRTQAGAAFLAGAAAWFSGRLEGVVFVSAGPAVTNLATGMLVARDNGWPLLVVGGTRSPAGRATGRFQEGPAGESLGPIVKARHVVRHPADLQPILRRAVADTRVDRPGPVFVEIPEDVLAADAAPESGDPAPAPPSDTPPAGPAPDIAAMVDELRRARRPALILGDGCRWSLDPAGLRDWIERLGLPTACLGAMRGVIPDNHPLAFHPVRSEVLAGADWVLVAGARLDWRLRFGGERAVDARWHRVDWDPGHGEGVVPGSTLTLADPGRAVGDFLAAWDATPGPAPADWRGWTTAVSERLRRLREEPGVPPSGSLSLHELARTLRRKLPARATVILDGNLTLQAGLGALEAALPWRWLDPGWNGCMGGAIGYGMAARIVRPDEPVVVLTGDFAFGLGLIELETARRHHLPLCVVVANNSGNTGGLRQRNHLPAGHPERVHAYSPDTRYDVVAAGLGWQSRRVGTIGDLETALDEALRPGVPTLIDAEIDPYDAGTRRPGPTGDGE